MQNQQLHGTQADKNLIFLGAFHEEFLVAQKIEKKEDVSWPILSLGIAV